VNELRELAARDPIAAASDRWSMDRRASGVSLRVDEYWLWWYHRLRAWQGPWPSNRPTLREWRLLVGAHRSMDFDYRPDDWAVHCTRRGLKEDAHPVSVIVILREELEGKPVEEPDGPAYVGDHPVIFEKRPTAHAHALGCGDFVKGSRDGTLGGFLWRPRESRYIAVTCGHVVGPSVGQPVYSRPAGSPIGTVADVHYPAAKTGKCNNRIQSGAPSVDAALIDLHAGATVSPALPGLGTVARMSAIADLGQGDDVEFTGFTSKSVQARIKECNIWKELLVAGTPTCFGDLFVLESRTPKYVVTSLSSPGDSGAWVVSSVSGLATWDGLLVGGDGFNSYCCYSEHVMDAFGGQVALPP
jgi:hypothetical protein